MCECPCGDIMPSATCRIGDATIAVDVYPGCDGCGSDPLVCLYVFNDAGAASFLPGVTPEVINPDEYGGNDGKGLRLEVLTVDDLKRAILATDEADESEVELDDIAAAFDRHGRRWLWEAIGMAEARRIEGLRAPKEGT